MNNNETTATTNAEAEAQKAIAEAKFEPGTPYYDQAEDQKQAAIAVANAQNRAQNAQQSANEADEAAEEAERIADEAQSLLEDLEQQVEERRQKAEEARTRADAAQDWANAAKKRAQEAATALGAYTAQILAGATGGDALRAANAATGTANTKLGFYNAVKDFAEKAQEAADEACADKEEAEEARDYAADDSDELGNLLQR